MKLSPQSANSVHTHPKLVDGSKFELPPISVLTTGSKSSKLTDLFSTSLRMESKLLLCFGSIASLMNSKDFKLKKQQFFSLQLQELYEIKKMYKTTAIDHSTEEG